MPLSLRLAVIAVMLLSATALTMIGFRLVRPAQNHAMAMPAPLNYLVAAQALPAGTLARDADFRAVPLAPGAIPPLAVPATPGALADLRGALIRTWIDAGKPIRLDELLRPRDRGFIASVLSPGMRAASIGVDPVTGVSGLIWPGDHVDVLLTQSIENTAPAHRILSETVLRDVRVIGVDQAIIQGAPPGVDVAGHLARTVTLEVTPNQAEKLMVARDLGQLSLTICAAADGRATLATGGVTGADVSPTLSMNARPLGRSVQLIQGDRRDQVVFP